MLTKVLYGRERELSLANGEKRKIQFAIVDLDEIVASHNEITFSTSQGYPVNAAGRNINDRNYQDDTAAQRNVYEIAQNLEPERLIELSSKPAGTPIISVDGFVVSGNNRVMSLKLAIKRFPENYESYKRYLAGEIDIYGFENYVGTALLLNESIPLPGSSYNEPKKVKFNHPVLVRIDKDIPSLNTTELAKYNLDTKKGERPVDRVIKLSNIFKENEKCRQVVISIIDGYDTFSEFFSPGSQPTADRKRLLKAFIDCGLIPEAKVPEYFNEGMFTDAGKDFVENILASIILEPDSLKVAGTDGVKRFRQTVITSLPVLIANENLLVGSLIKFISEAFIVQYRIYQLGSFDDFLSNRGLFEEKEPDARSVFLNRLMELGRNKFKEQISRYNEAIRSNTGESLFGDIQLSPDEIFQKTIVEALPPGEAGRILKRFGMSNDTPPITSPELIAPDETVANLDLFANDLFFIKNPDKILGIAYETSGRFGPVTKYKGDINDIRRIEAPDNFISNERAINDGVLSIDHSGNLSAELLRPDVEQFITEVNAKSQEEVGRRLARKQKNKTKDPESLLTTEIPELQSFEEIYELYNPEISTEELEAFIWYKTSVKRPLSRRWARLVDKGIPTNNLNTAYNYEVPDAKVNIWVSRGILYYHEGKLLPAAIYLSGDIYEKKFALEKEREYITEKYGRGVYELQVAALEQIFREKYSHRLTIGGVGNKNGLVILPISKFATEFSVEVLESMGDGSQFKMKKVTAASSKKVGMPDFLKDAETKETKKEVFDRLNLKDAFAYWLIRNKPDLIEKVTHQEIIKNYIQGTPLRTKLSEYASDAQRMEEQSQFAKLKSSLQKEAERLFSIFLDKELTLNDKVRLETTWNARFNNYVPVNYNKIPVAFTMTKYYKGKPEIIRPEKREAVAFIMTSGTGCLAYDVGVGKTPSSIFTISAFLDAGYCRRPFICVPNQVYKQFISEIKGFVPHIPIIEAYNLSESYIENFKNAEGNIAQVPEGTITVMTYEGLEQIGFNDNTYQQLFNSLYDILNQGGESERGTTEKQKEGFNERLGTLLGRGLRGSLFNIEDFGFDFACYDEAHKLKKVFTAVKGEAETDEKGKVTRGKSPYVINSGSPSSIGLKAFMLNQYILKSNDYNNILLLTATPFTNSPLEIFSMLAMLAYEQLQNTDLNNIKNFFDTYIKTSTELVINPSLKPEYKQVVVGFNNLVSLQSLIRRYINFKTGEDVNVQRPAKYVLPYLRKEVDGTVITLDQKERVETYLQMTSQQKAMMDDIVLYVEGKMSFGDLQNTAGSFKEELVEDRQDQEDEDIVNSEGEEISEDSLGENEKAGVKVLRGINLARNLALSPYLYGFSGMRNPSYLEYIETSPKLKYIIECIRSVKEYHQGKGEVQSGQVIYMDRGVQYFGLIKEYLINEIGYKPHEIGIIKSGMPTGGKRNSKDYIKNLFNGETYNESTKLFEPVSDEDRIKIIIGSSTIKEGINLQRYGTMLYNAFVDWNPSDSLQLQGRIWRQGNLYEAIRYVIPLLLDSMDIFIFQKLQEKTTRINTIWASDGRTNVLSLEEFDPSELKYAMIRDPYSIANLKVLDQQAAIESEMTGIRRLEERVKRILDDMKIMEQHFDNTVDSLAGYRVFTKTNGHINDAPRLVQVINELYRNQTDATGKKLAPYDQRERMPFAEKEKYSRYPPFTKPYWLDSFNKAQRNLAIEKREFAGPSGIRFNLYGMQDYLDDKKLEIKKLEESITKLSAPENIAKFANEVIEDRKSKKFTYKTLSEVVQDFAKLNYLLSLRKVFSPNLKPLFDSCPPMLDGERIITDEAISFLEECAHKGTDTKTLFTDPDTGQYTPGRAAIHDNIVEAEFRNVRCVKQGKPIAVFTGGSPGSGKSQFLKKHAEFLLSPDIFHLDADAIREDLPEYQGWNANATHRETQDIVNKLLGQIGDGKCRYDFIYDGTMNKANKYFSLINKVKRMGYETFIIFMVVPYGIAKRRVLDRYKRTGRYVPLAVVDEFFEKLPDGKTRGEDALDQLKSVVDGYVVVDGTTGDVIDRGGKEIPRDRSYGEFFGPKGTEGDETMPDPKSTQEKPIASPGQQTVTDKKKIVTRLIKGLTIGKKYLKGVQKASAEKQITALKISIKYL